MPTYHYKCQSCEHEFSCVRRMLDAAAVHCLRCHQGVKQLIRSGSFHLKGDTWYHDGYESKSEQKDGEK